LQGPRRGPTFSVHVDLAPSPSARSVGGRFRRISPDMSDSNLEPSRRRVGPRVFGALLAVIVGVTLVRQRSFRAAEAAFHEKRRASEG